MSQLNDCIVAATGNTDINDGLRAHYLANGATGGDGLQLNDLEYQFLVANGATPSDINDMWKQILPPVVGFDGQLNDMLLPFWCAGGTFAPPAPPAFNANPVGEDPWPASFEATEEAFFQFDCKPYWEGGGYISQWSLSGDVPAWMTITASGIIRGTPPLGDGDYTGIIVTGTNATGPAASSPSTPVNTPANVLITFNPQSQFVEIGSMVTFSAAASDASGYQWYRNGVAIPGATSFAYTTPAIAQSDDLAEYFCRVEGIGGVTRDTTPAVVTAMETFNNREIGGAAVVQITLAAGTYTLSMLGSGLTTIREISATIIGL